MTSVWNPESLRGMRLGSCVLEGPLGIGGMGAVYLAQQEQPHRRVAVKVLRPQLAVDAEDRRIFLERFRREADATAALDHANIVPIYAFGEENGVAYLVMPYLADGSLARLLEREEALPLGRALPYVEQAAAALDYAHAHGIVHRDVKPSNLLLHPDGRLMLADFGIARPMGARGLRVMRGDGAAEGATPGGAYYSDDAALTQMGAAMGTPEYMAPEQARGEQVGPAADIYALGIVTYMLLTGRSPFAGGAIAEVLTRQLVAPPQPIRLSHPDVPARVEEAIFWALAKDPSERPARASMFAKALREGSRTRTLSGAFGGGWLQQSARDLAAGRDALDAREEARGAGAVGQADGERTAFVPLRQRMRTLPLPQMFGPVGGQGVVAGLAEGEMDAADGRRATTHTTLAGGATGRMARGGGERGAMGGAPLWPGAAGAGGGGRAGTLSRRLGGRGGRGAWAALIAAIVVVFAASAGLANALTTTSLFKEPAGHGVGVAHTPTLTATPSPTVTPQPTATPVLNWLVVAPASVTLDCRKHVRASVQLTNQGPIEVQWKASIPQVGGVKEVTVSPSEGSLQVGASVMVVIGNTLIPASRSGDVTFAVTVEDAGSSQGAGQSADVAFSAANCFGGG